MPWSAKDAKKHDKQANTPKRQRQWAHIANAVLRQTGDEARAIRAANAKVGGKRKRSR